MRVALKYKRLLRFSFTALYLSGSGYWLLRQFFRKIGQYGEEPNYLERVFGPTHLIAALFFIFAMGILWNTHVNPAIRTGRHRFSGWLFLLLIGCLATTATVILYGSEDLIKLAERYHPWIGLFLLPTLVIHWNFRKSKRSA